MSIQRLAGPTAALLLAFAALGAARDLHAQTTTVILVRHAEKRAGEDRDPPLSAAGEARAAALADALADAGVDAIYATPFRRTLATAAPLAERLGLEVRTTPVEDGIAAHVRDVARRMRTDHAGGTVLVVGHSNTVPLIAGALLGRDLPQLAEDAYGDLFIVQLPSTGGARLIRARYGPDRPAAAGTGAGR